MHTRTIFVFGDFSLHCARGWPEYDNLTQIPEVAVILREPLPP